MTGNENLTVQFGEDPPWDEEPDYHALGFLRIAIEAKWLELDRLQQEHIKLTGQRHKWFR